MFRRSRYLCALALALVCALAARRLQAADSESAPSRAVVEGERVMLFVDIGAGSPPFTYQWSKNGVPIAGATEGILTFLSVQPGDAGSYTVTVANDAGSITTDPESLEVKTVLRSRIAQVSVQASRGENLITGFAVAGGDGSTPARLLARVAGPALGQFGVSSALPDPWLSVFSGTRLVASNNDWAGDPAVAQAAVSAGTFPFLPASKDAAMLLFSDPGSYTARVTDATGGTGTAMMELYDFDSSADAGRPRLVNVSARGWVSPNETLVAGFTLTGETPATLLLRGIGPALSQLGLNGVLPDPRLRLFQGATLISGNENWSDFQSASLTEAADRVGAFALPNQSADAALLIRLQPGAYTVQVDGYTAAGLVLIEIYEVPQ